MTATPHKGPLPGAPSGGYPRSGLRSDREKAAARAVCAPPPTPTSRSQHTRWARRYFFAMPPSTGASKSLPLPMAFQPRNPKITWMMNPRPAMA